MDVKEFICEDGTMMRSARQDELIRALQYHNETYHNMKTSEEEAMKYIKNVE